MPDHHLDDLIRTVDPGDFSAAAHGAGQRIVLARGKARLHEPSLLGRLFARHDESHWFVKVWSVPKEVKDWRFRWSEGTSAISLDFDASFVLQANEDHQALRLVEVLHGANRPGEVLYGLINAALHQELERMLRESNSKAASLLDCFRRSSVGLGESEELDRRITESVSKALGGALFRIGFQLTNAPPMQIEVRQTDAFTLADSKQARTAQTTALLHLDNYQAYKKSGLDSEARVRETIGRAISQAVKQLLFAGKYYSVVRSFTLANDSIEDQMRERIRHEARSIGYRVDMFQTYPDIAALKLLDPLRIDIPAGDDKYFLVNSSGYVQVGLALSVRVDKDFSRLHLLIDPDATDVTGPIVEQVRRLCRDTVQRFGRMEFNLGFDETVVPAIRQAIEHGLAGYGLVTQVIHVVQAPTEDAQRFMAIRGQTIGFEATIDAQADAGDDDQIHITGKIEVTGMLREGWERFEAKDYGYRQDTHLTPARLRQLATQQKLEVPEGEVLAQADRRQLAIDLELIDIRDRAMGALCEALSKVPNLAALWRSMAHSREIIDHAQRIAGEAVTAEFGLSVALRAVRRDSTLGEQTNAVRRQSQLEFLRGQAQHDAEFEMEKRKLLSSESLKLLQEAGRKDRDALDDEGHAQHAAVRARADELATGAKDASRLIGGDPLSVLPRPAKAGEAPAALPWQSAPPAPPALPAGPGPSAAQGSD